MHQVPDQPPLPLAGLRVVTTANALPAAIVGQVLADAGAEVWLLEPPGGSRLRVHPAWSFWARGQHSLEVDLTRDGDRALARALVDRSDVFVDGWATGVASRLGLDADELRAANPRLVHTRISAFGDDSPLAGIKGWESVVMATIGASTSFSLLTSRPGPAFVSAPFCSVAAAHHALQGLLGALVERERSGVGQGVAVSLAHSYLAYDTWNWLLLVLADRYGQAFESAPPFDVDHLVPNTPFVFRLMVALSADGQWLQFSQTTDRLWEAFLRSCGLDPDDGAVRDAPLSDDPAERVAFWERLLAAVASRTVDEWLAVFDTEPDVWADTFRAGPSALEHPQLLADARVVTDDHGRLMPAELARSERWPAFALAPPPALGADAARAADVVASPIPSVTPREPTGDAPALDGVTIVELGSFFAAPFGATLIAEQGARVVKIEPPAGDAIRNLVPFPEVAGVKVLHGKESVVLDLDRDDDRAVFDALIARADVVLQGYRAGVAERMRVTAADLHAINPELVYVSSPGYGNGPPCGRKPAFAPTMGAASGLAVRDIGGASCLPVGTDLALDEVKRTSIRLAAGAMGPANADGFAALGVGTAIALGVLGQVRQGGGNVLHTSMLSTIALALADSNVDDGTGTVAGVDPELLGLAPWHRLYPTADGWVMLAALSHGERDALATHAGVDLDDPAAAAMLEQRFLSAPSAQHERELRAAGVTCVEVAAEAADRHVTLGAMGVEHGWVTTGHHAVIDDYPRATAYTTFSRSRSVLGPAPTLGQHTDAVRAEVVGEDARVPAP
ncbi:MAG TPA: CoA transferase [Acidimicrobiia bacterium]|nr:CoA transferase [Acidimicrobiia bacterium]